MKTINIIYWITTGILMALMLWSAYGSLTDYPPGVEVMKHLQYPPYLGHFLGIAKILGAIAILVPGFPQIKEWAYAGFAIDLIGASYSSYAVGDPASRWGFIFAFLIILAVSYICYHKKLAAVLHKDAVA